MFDLKVLDEVSTLFGLPETTNNLSSWQYVLHSVVRGTHATFGIFFFTNELLCNPHAVTPNSLIISHGRPCVENFNKSLAITNVES